MQNQNHILNLDYYVEIEIFSFLDFKDLQNLACTCQKFHNLLQQGKLWKGLAVKLGSRAPVTCTNIQVETNEFYKFLRSAVKTFYYGQKSKIDKNGEQITLGTQQKLIGVEASSTDFNQSIEKVLTKNDKMFWSSLGHASEDSEEQLLFLFADNLVVPFSVRVVFFEAKDFYEQGTLEFPSKQVQVEFGFDGKNWEYASDLVDVNGQHQVNIKIIGKVGLARYIRVRLIGKQTLQPTDNLYYNAVKDVECFGYKLNSKDGESNKLLDEMLVDSYVNWQKQEEQFKIVEEGIDKELVVKNIYDYYHSGTFPPKIYSEFLELLKSKEDDKIWMYLETHKFLLTCDETFLNIFRVHKDFAAVYLSKVVKKSAE